MVWLIIVIPLAFCIPIFSITIGGILNLRKKSINNANQMVHEYAKEQDSLVKQQIMNGLIEYMETSNLGPSDKEKILQKAFQLSKQFSKERVEGKSQEDNF